MRRQVTFLSAVTLMIVTLVAGLIGGAVMGGAAGYWYGHRHGSNVRTVAAALTSETPKATQSPSSAAGGSSNGSTQSYDAVVAKVNKAVVTINNQTNAPNGSGSTTAGIGSGFIIDNQGHIVTNNHVVDGADSLQVVFSDGTTAPAKLVGTDQYQDVAVIKVDVPVPGTVSFGDSSKIQPGQRVLAIGSALGQFRNTVTDGIVGGVDRSLDTGEGYNLANLIQHDAPINPGNSGGPLITTDGQVVGMNTAVVRGGFGQPGAEGLGFAIASNTVKQYAEELIAHGQISHPYLGISFRPAGGGQGNALPGADTGPQPVVVAQVVSGSPAAKAGLQAGDQITAVDGVTLDGQHPFLNTMFTHKPGDTVKLTVQRNGSQQTVSVTLGERPVAQS